MIEAELRQVMLDDPVVKQRLGKSVYVGINPSKKDDDFLLITAVSHDQKVYVSRELGVKRTTFQFDIYCKKLIDASRLRTYLIGLLHGKAIYRHDLPLDVRLMELDNMRSDFDAADNQHRISLDFTFIYN